MHWDGSFSFLLLPGVRLINEAYQDLAYVETSFMMIRLLQVFDRFTVAQAECAPPDYLPPASWKSRPNRMATEEFWPSLAISMYSKVSPVVDNAPRSILDAHPDASQGGLWLRSYVAE